MVSVVPLLAGGLAAVHVFAGKLRFQEVVPRSRWLSVAGGVSVAYVFVHIFPEMMERQSQITTDTEAATTVLATALEHTIFVVALAGFVSFYGLEQLAHRSRRQAGRREVVDGVETRTTAGVFWIHVGSFAAYNALIGYLLLHRESAGVWNLLLYVIAMAFHFVVNDHGLREHHEDAYDHVGRWLLAGAVFVGLLVGYLTTIPEILLSSLFGLLAGGVIFNVIKEELPEERESRFLPFGLGVVTYAIILLLVR